VTSVERQPPWPADKVVDALQTSLKRRERGAPSLYEGIYCARAEMENRINAQSGNARRTCLQTGHRPQRWHPTSCACGLPPWHMFSSAPCAGSGSQTRSSPTLPAARPGSRFSRSVRASLSRSGASGSPWRHVIPGLRSGAKLTGDMCAAFRADLKSPRIQIAPMLRTSFQLYRPGLPDPLDRNRLINRGVCAALPVRSSSTRVAPVPFVLVPTGLGGQAGSGNQQSIVCIAFERPTDKSIDFLDQELPVAHVLAFHRQLQLSCVDMV